eukprot:RCo048303
MGLQHPTAVLAFALPMVQTFLDTLPKLCFGCVCVCVVFLHLLPLIWCMLLPRPLCIVPRLHSHPTPTPPVNPFLHTVPPPPFFSVSSVFQMRRMTPIHLVS